MNYQIQYRVPSLGIYSICERNKIWHNKFCIFAGKTFEHTKEVLVKYLVKLMIEESVSPFNINLDEYLYDEQLEALK